MPVLNEADSSYFVCRLLEVAEERGRRATLDRSSAASMIGALMAFVPDMWSCRTTFRSDLFT